MTHKTRTYWKCVLGLGAALSLSTPAGAHGGGLNAEGCHTNRKTGDYHCHRAASPAPPPQAIQPAYSSGFSGQAGQTEKRQRAYANCTEARAAGAAPVRIGDPGYGPHLDRDNDGVGCE